jgi:catechol 2,3-dioxygenase-like lactoylglutathione lyase family enzyme
MLNNFEVSPFIATAHGRRAKAFYTTVLGLTLVEDSAAALVFDAHGTMVRIAKVPQLAPAPYTVLGWSVPDIRAAIQELSNHGVTFERLQGMAQDEMGVWTSPEGNRVTWFKDPDGNILSLTEFRH